MVALLPVVALPALAADSRLHEAQREGEQAQAELDELLQRIEGLKAEREDVEARLAELQQQAVAEGDRAAQADSASLQRARQLYMQSTSDPGMAVLTSDSPEEAAEQARLLAFLQRTSQTDFEVAAANQTNFETQAQQVAFETEQLQGRLADLETARAEAERFVQERLARVEQIQRQIEEEERARRAAEAAAEREREQQRQRQSNDQPDDQPDDEADDEGTEEPPDDDEPVPPATSNGEIACPVGDPNHFSDTYGAPRSGGRSHKGVDIMASTGTPAYAYENGTVTRMNSNSLGGISLYLEGDSGNLYYYTHLSGYVDSVDVGDQVSVGQHLAYVGMTGNAPVPHLHWEVMPGGGGNVNPYPYAKRACG
jgi:murein DD-endopeptidase MepM/ murein hydrolase activator NlpD